MKSSTVLLFGLVLSMLGCATSAGTDDGDASGVDLAGSVTCPDDTTCGAGLYCFTFATGPQDAGGRPLTYTCRAPENGCTVAPDGLYSNTGGAAAPAGSTCADTFCARIGSATVSGNGRIVWCQGP